MLNDLRVLDLTTGFGLMCGQLLADMGAEVQQWVRPSDAMLPETHEHWRAYTLGKGVQVVDWVGQPERLREQVALADVLLESTPGELVRLGLDPATLAGLNPRLIHVSITGFGCDGPKAGYAWTDLTVTAASGHLYLSGAPEAAPLRISSPQAHAHAAADAAVAVLLALAERDRSGLGQHIDIAGQQSQTLALLSRALDGKLGQPKALRAAYQMVMGPMALRNQFQARDGWVVVLQGVLPPLAAFMERLMAWVYEEGLCPASALEWSWGEAGMRMALGEITNADWAPVQDGIEALVARYSKRELMDAAVSRRLLIAPVLTVAELLDSEQIAARGVVVEGRSGRRLGAFAHLSASPLPLRESAPRFWSGTPEGWSGTPETTWFGTPEKGAEKGTPEQRPRSGTPELQSVQSGTPKQPGAASVRGHAFGSHGFQVANGEGPLAGLKVLDLFWIVAGPGATRMLADYGATVVHVESSRRLDMVRNVPPYIEGVTDPERAGCHHTTNCNKLNITLDLGSEEGRAILVDLIRWADVFTESFAPGVVERMGFGYEQVRALNPSIIMISSSLMGQSGPWRSYAGYGNLAAAVSGFHALTGHVEQPPTGCFGPYTDFTSIRFNALAMLGALRHRGRTGEGQYIDMGQAEAALHFLAPECLTHLRPGPGGDAVPVVSGNRDRHCVPSVVLPTRGSDRWIALSVESEAQWTALCEVAELGDLLAAGVRSLDQRRQREAEIEARLADWARDQDGAALEAALQARGVPAHRVADTVDLAEDPQLAHRGHFIEVDHRAFRPAAVESARLRFSRSAARMPAYAPWFGIDNERVLAEVLGYDDGRIAALQAAGVLR